MSDTTTTTGETVDITPDPVGLRRFLLAAWNDPGQARFRAAIMASFSPEEFAWLDPPAVDEN